MTMVLADSIGFSATHTITHILAEIPDSYVTHGSRNFISRQRYSAEENTPPSQFAEDMAKINADGKHCYAVHCSYPAQEISAACQAMGIKYGVIVRDPIKQIRSCMAWAKKKVENNDEAMRKTAIHFNEQFAMRLRLRPSLDLGLFIYASHHVSAFYRAALEVEAPLFKMEDLLSDEAYFREVFEVPEGAVLSHFSGEAVHQSSHVAKVASVHKVDEKAEQKVLEAMIFQVGDKGFSWEEYRAALGY